MKRTTLDQNSVPNVHSKKTKTGTSSSSSVSFSVVGFTDPLPSSSAQAGGKGSITVQSFRSSQSGRLQRSSTVHEIEPLFELPPPSQAPLEEGSYGFDEFGSLLEQDGLIVESLDIDSDAQIQTQLETTSVSQAGMDNTSGQIAASDKKQKLNRMKTALLRWLPMRRTAVEEVIRHESFGNTKSNICSNSSCLKGDAIYRCTDCFGSSIYCKTCILDCHRLLPFHRIKVYKSNYFEKTSLRELGLELQLGHDNNSVCHNSSPGPKDFTVVDVSGIHTISINFCNCGHSKGGSHRYNQILRAGWFPATVDLPATAVTFDCLDTFLEVNQQSKVNTYDFYISLTRLTDNTGKISADSRYHEFSLVIRLWRHVQTLKRSGRAHDPQGIDATREGALAVECPACPHPSRNLPSNWEELPNQWLYTQFLAVDANFRLKLKDRGLQDIELSPGWAYYVEEEKFQTFIGNHKSGSEPNTCRSHFNALLHATTQNLKGYKASGVGAVVCGRHSFVRPNGVCDLQLGERYVNMDYIILNTLTHSNLQNIVISYDIACQWCKHFTERQSKFPEYMQIPEDVLESLRTAVPKFHLPGHGPACQTRFSLNFLPFVGRTYGEGVESEWAHINALSTGAREMAPGMRHETLNAHWGSWNWGKVTTMGALFKKNFVEAVSEHKKQAAIFTEFSATFPTSVLEEWETKITDWEEDPTSPDPYAEVNDTITLNEVRLQLAKEEAEAQLTDTNLASAHKTSQSAFLSEGLELEEQQRHLLLRDTSRDHQLNKKSASVQERRNSLWTVIERWRKVQDHYMPSAASMRVLSADDPASTTAEEGAVKHPETLRLCLPSALPTHLIDENMKTLRSREARLRRAQAEDALAHICRLRRTMTGVYIFKRLNVSGTGQRANTRIRSIYNRLMDVCGRAVARYRAARAALCSLDPDGDWKAQLLVLHDKDVSGPQRDPEKDTSEGRFELSWIWRLPGSVDTVSEESPEFSESMRIEWSRVRARKARWEEEILLLAEEMRRVVAFLEWKANWWMERSATAPSTSGDATIQAGLRCYAAKQAAILCDIASRFVGLCAPVLQRNNVPAPWLKDYMKRYPVSRSKAALTIDADLSDLFRSL